MRAIRVLAIVLAAAFAARADDPTLGGVKRSQWVKRLSSDQDPDVRAKAAGVLGEMRWFAGPGGPALAKALAEDGYEPVREEAAEALGKIEDPDLAVPALLAAFKDKSLAVRSRAARSLGGYGPKAAAALPTLTSRMTANGEWDALSAAVAVARIDPAKDAGIRRLLTLIQDAKEADVRTFALSGLTLEVEPDTLRKHAALVTPALITLLKSKPDPKDDGDPTRRMAAIDGLATLGPAVTKDAVPVLTAHLTGMPQYVRLKAAGTLHRIDPKNSSAVKAVVTELTTESRRHPNRFNSREPAMLVAEFGPAAKDAVPELIALLKAGDTIHTQTREAAVYALGRIGPAATAALPELLPDLKGKNELWRFEAARAVARIEPTNADAVSVLKGYALTPGPRVGTDRRSMALDALAEHPRERGAIVRLALAALREPQRLETRDEYQFDRLVISRSDLLAAVKSDCAAILGQYGLAKEASPALAAMLTHEDLTVRLAAATALRKIDAEAFAKHLGKK